MGSVGWKKTVAPSKANEIVWQQLTLEDPVNETLANQSHPHKCSTTPWTQNVAPPRVSTTTAARNNKTNKQLPLSKIFGMMTRDEFVRVIAKVRYLNHPASCRLPDPQ